MGLSDEVLPPWTPVRVAGDKIGVWDRTYRFGALPLPASAIARDAEMLAAPITLSGTVDGKPLVWSGDACRVVESRPNLARLRATAQAGALGCTGNVQVEYDGMIRCDFQLAPQHGKTTIERLALEIPLDARHAAFLHTWPGQWGSAGNSAALPQGGVHGPFKPFIWLGDTERGFCWFAESDQNFFPAQADRVWEIERAGDRVLLRINLFARRTIDRPLSYTFGFQATPVKPSRPDAWDYRIVHMGDYGLQSGFLDHLAGCGVRTMCFHEHWTDIQNYPTTTHGADLDKLVAACHQRKIQLLPYFGYEMSDIAPSGTAITTSAWWIPGRANINASPSRPPTSSAIAATGRIFWPRGSIGC